jgi:hypothetical protein
MACKNKSIRKLHENNPNYVTGIIEQQKKKLPEGKLHHSPGRQ